MRSFSWMAIFAVSVLGSSACATQMSQAKVAVASDSDTISRADALNVVPAAICKRFESCNQVGKDHKYATAEDCQTQEKAKWGKAWSEDKCGPPHALLAGKVRECEQRATTWQCGGNVLDFGGLLSECGASDVCK